MNSLTNSGLKPFCTEISFKNGAWKEYFRLYRRTFEYTVRVAGPDLAYFFAMKQTVRSPLFFREIVDVDR